MTTTRPNFTGPYQEVLTELAGAIDELWSGHATSFVKAADDKVYALGGDGYAVVLDENKWDGLVEVLTPKLTVSIRPKDDGTLDVTAAGADEEAIRQSLKESAEALRKYYENRYWRTPKIP